MRRLSPRQQSPTGIGQASSVGVPIIAANAGHPKLSGFKFTGSTGHPRVGRAHIYSPARADVCRPSRLMSFISKDR